MREAEPGDAPDQQIVQVRVRDQGGREGRQEDVHRRPAVGVGDRRQIDERLDGTVAERSPEPRVLLGHLGFRRVRRPFDADLPQVAEGGLDGAGGAARGLVDLDLGAGDGGEVDEGPRAAGQRGEPLLRGRGVAAQVLALGAIELEGEGELVAALPAVLGQEGAAGGEVGERRGVGRGLLGAPARRQIDLGHALALLARGDQGRPAVQLGRDLERPLPALGGRRARPEPAPDLEVQPRPLALGDQRVGGLLHAVVREATGMVDPEHQVLLDRRVEHRFGIAPQHGRHRSTVDDGPDVGGQRQGLLRLAGQLAQLGHHQVHDVVGRALGADARHVPGPAARWRDRR